MLYRPNVVTPEMIRDMLHAVTKVTGLVMILPPLEYRFDEGIMVLFQQDMPQASEKSSNLWSFLGNAMNWQDWQHLEATAMQERSREPIKPFVRHAYHGLLACAVAPIVQENQVLGEIASEFAIVEDVFDWQIHQYFAQAYALSWPSYQTAIEHTPHLTMDQLDGVAQILGAIAQAVANLPMPQASFNQEIAAHQSSRKEHKYWKEITRQAISFMRENLENSIGVAEVSQAVALTPAYFSMLFSKQIGCSPCDYLIELRLERAKQYLTYTRMPVKEVGVVLGYSRSYFSRLFKRQIGCTPQEYARRMRAR
jgi:AraC-like DNA-binding protein